MHHTAAAVTPSGIARLRPAATAVRDRLPEPAATTQTGPTFPLVYAMQFVGRSVCGRYRDGDLLAINTMDEPKAGDLVCVHLKNDMAQMMYLALALAPGMLDRLPWVPRHKDEPVPAIVGAGLYGGQAQYRATDVWAVHKCDGIHDPEAASQAA